MINNIHAIKRLKNNPNRLIRRSHGEFLVEGQLIKALKRNKINDFTSEYRVSIETPFGKKTVYLDFVLKKGSKYGFIEVDGLQHFQYCPQFHQEKSDFLKQLHRDKLVNEFCNTHGKILRLSSSLTDMQMKNKIRYFLRKL